MSARCLECGRLLCDHYVPQRIAVVAEARQLALPLEDARAAVDGGANRRTPAARQATAGQLAAEVATGQAARALTTTGES